MRTRSSEKKKARVSLDPTFDEQRRLVLPELGEAIRLDDDTFIRSLYHHVAPQLAIDTFLKKSRFYSLTQRRWKLPRNCCKLLNDDFHTPFFDVFSSILKHFWRDPTAHGTREVVDTHTSDLQHREADSIIHHSRPSLVIKAKGPSFQLPYAKPGEKQSKVGYSNISACIDIQIDGNALSISDQLVRATIYARQIFIHQPNRRFVRVLLLTEQHVRLFHFDRSGAQYTPLLDFHDNPHTFVRLVLGLSSPRETDVGLDDSIQWTTQDGRKVSGTLRTCGTNNEDIIYQLAAIQPFFFNDSIRGRSTICWSVRDPITDEELVVKDSWRSEDRLSEHIFLQDAVGVPGVVQMVTCEPDRCETKSLREFGDVLPAGFRNRIETRIVMKTYGKSVCRYTSPKQLFCALRDAIAGHMELFKKGTIHRDVSLQNVLLGKPGAESGYRGVLIDFDISILRSLNKPADWRMGTRLYQSVPVLYSATVPHPLPHDHLDDLESFLYILVHIMFTCDSNGAAHAANEMLSRWDKFGDDPYSVATFKESYLTRKIVPRDIQQRWPSPCVDLILAFAAFIRPLVQDKLALDYMEPTVRNGGETVFAVGATQHYSHILHLFDTAIEALDRPDTWRVLVPFPDDKKDCSSKAPPSSHPASRPDIQPAANPPKNPARSSLKRASDDYPDDQPAAKRSNSPQSSRSSFVPLPRHSHEGSVPSPT